MVDIEKLKYDDNGLIAAVIQDNTSKKVLTVAYMNKESLSISIKEGKTCFYSRSRNTLWRKGETSGNFQSIVSITADCDLDSLLIVVDKAGPACHNGTDSCFTNEILKNDESSEFSFYALYDLLKSRKDLMPKDSYTTYLFEKGIDKILKKVGEECTEVIIASKASDKAETIYEIADLAYHIQVLMVEMGITVSDVYSELKSRHIIDKKIKQEKMK